MNVYQKINEIRKKVSYLKKDQQVSGAGVSYKAITRDSVISAIREHLVEFGIVVETTQISGEWSVMRNLNATPNPIKMGLYKGFYEIRFVNVDDPQDRAIVNFEAHANDNGDKAPGKAATYAEKTALIKQFSLETGINDEEIESTKMPEEVSSKFLYLIESEDARGLSEFMDQYPSDSPLRNQLFDSLPYGQKTKLKDKFLEVCGSANKMYDEWALELDEAVTNGHTNAITELWWDEDEIHKRKVWGRISGDSKEFLKKNKE